MVIIQNKYSKVYDAIIYRAKSRVFSDIGNYELHHITPKSLGGSDEEDNIVVLTLREHFICHLLLVRFTKGDDKRRMAYAAMRMANTSKYKVCARLYDSIKSERRKMGASEETRAKISSANKGRGLGIPKSEETKEKLRNRVITEEMRENYSKAARNRPRRPHSQNTKDKIRQASLAQKTILDKCVRCGIEASVGNIRRWHGDNCRLNKEWRCKRGHDQHTHRVERGGVARCGECANETRRKWRENKKHTGTSKK